jgi:hypothetical protein
MARCKRVCACCGGVIRPPVAWAGVGQSAPSCVAVWLREAAWAALQATGVTGQDEQDAWGAHIRCLHVRCCYQGQRVGRADGGEGGGVSLAAGRPGTGGPNLAPPCDRRLPGSCDVNPDLARPAGPHAPLATVAHIHAHLFTQPGTPGSRLGSTRPPGRPLPRAPAHTWLADRGVSILLAGVWRPGGQRSRRGTPRAALMPARMHRRMPRPPPARRFGPLTAHC